MSYAALAIAFLLVCVAVGARSAHAERQYVATCLALAMVAGQLALLLS
jgi:hypothetical protein